MSSCQLKRLCARVQSILFLTITLSASGCNSAFENPLASPPIGSKTTIRPALVNSMPLTEDTDASRPRTTILRIGSTTDIVFAKSGQTSLENDKPAKFKSLALADKYGTVVKRTWDELSTVNNSTNCLAGRNDVHDFLVMYKSMTLICDMDFASAFRTAIKMTIVTDDSIDHEFTSWGSNWSDVGGSSVIVYSVSL